MRTILGVPPYKIGGTQSYSVGYGHQTCNTSMYMIPYSVCKCVGTGKAVSHVLCISIEGGGGPGYVADPQRIFCWGPAEKISAAKSAPFGVDVSERILFWGLAADPTCVTVL